MLKRKKLNRLQRREANKIKLEQSRHGEGMYVFRNRTSGDLMLSKPASDGQRSVPPGKTWQGDSYFMYMVNKEHTALLVETLQTPADERKQMEEQRLIVDQPDCITVKGKVEQVIVPETQKLNEVPSNEEKKDDVLLNDDAISGIEILMD